MENEKLFAWQMTAQKEALVLNQMPFPHLEEGEALVKVAGCGVCHTDIGFWHEGVPVKHALPLTLGHEISGTVVAGPDAWAGKNVIIPAVLPCGNCELCNSGRSNICQNQKMPGNDFNGGFASHIRVPARFLCPVPDKLLKKFSLHELAVIADAVSTPFQVIEKCELRKNDLVIAIGMGGIGLYGAQIANALGAKVVAIDISNEKLEMAKSVGAGLTINSAELDVKSIKEMIRNFGKSSGANKYGWKILEMSGKKAGQELAFAMLTYASTLSVVGFTLEKLELRLSNLMAFDAKIIGTWGCKAELYPEILNWIEDGRIKIQPFIQTFPMSRINEVFEGTLKHSYSKRTILIPDFN